METYYNKVLSLRCPHALVYVYPTKAAPLYMKPLVCPPPPLAHCRAEAAAGPGMSQMGKIVMFLRVLRQRQTDRRTYSRCRWVGLCSTPPKASHNIISTNNDNNAHRSSRSRLCDSHGSSCRCYSLSAPPSSLHDSSVALSYSQLKFVD